ncbi:MULTISPECIES: hypothetical protein [unclassified Streptomyces]|uniref:hypothetical protein n=1 Tax=unclassified Streptomyces TaxID=2593676 RepID=UPI0036D88AEB
MLDESGTHRRRTGRDHLRVQCAATGLPARRADEVLDHVGLARAGGVTASTRSACGNASDAVKGS